METGIECEASPDAASEIENPDVGFGIAQCDGDALAVGRDSFTVIGKRFGGFADSVALAIEPHEIVAGLNTGSLVEQHTTGRCGKRGMPSSGIVVDSVDESHGGAGKRAISPIQFLRHQLSFSMEQQIAAGILSRGIAREDKFGLLSVGSSNVDAVFVQGRAAVIRCEV